VRLSPLVRFEQRRDECLRVTELDFAQQVPGLSRHRGGAHLQRAVRQATLGQRCQSTTAMA